MVRFCLYSQQLVYVPVSSENSKKVPLPPSLLDVRARPTRRGPWVVYTRTPRCDWLLNILACLHVLGGGQQRGELGVAVDLGGALAPFAAGGQPSPRGAIDARRLRLRDLHFLCGYRERQLQSITGGDADVLQL